VLSHIVRRTGAHGDLQCLNSENEDDNFFLNVCATNTHKQLHALRSLQEIAAASPSPLKRVRKTPLVSRRDVVQTNHIRIP